MASQCTGEYRCPAVIHVHGCYADFGRCDAPQEHHLLAEVTPKTPAQWGLVLVVAALFVAMLFSPAATCSISSEPSGPTVEEKCLQHYFHNVERQRLCHETYGPDAPTPTEAQ